MASIESRDGRPVRLLAFDGGGVRGLSSLRILQRIVEFIDPVNPPKPCECFEMICGTSTGGLIAIMLGSLKMSVAECIEEYQQLSPQVFTKTRSPVSWKAKVQGRYDHVALEKGIKDLLRHRGLEEDELMKEGDGDPRCKTFVCAMSQQTSKVILFPSYNTKTWDTTMLNRVRIWEAARATSAASSFFEPLDIDGRVFADGATGANNPVYELWSEALEVLFNGDENQRLNSLGCILSIGTGVPSLKSFRDSIPELAKAIKSIAIESEEKSNMFQGHFPSLCAEGLYFRFNVIQGLNRVGLGEADKLGDIDAYTDHYCNSPQTARQIESCAEILGHQRLLLKVVKRLQTYGKSAIRPTQKLQKSCDLDLDRYALTKVFRDWHRRSHGGLVCTIQSSKYTETTALAAHLSSHIKLGESHSVLYLDSFLVSELSKRPKLAARVLELKREEEMGPEPNAADITPVLYYLLSQLLGLLSDNVIQAALGRYLGTLSCTDRATFLRHVTEHGCPPTNYFNTLFDHFTQSCKGEIVILVDGICQLKECIPDNLLPVLCQLANIVKVLIFDDSIAYEAVGTINLPMVTPDTEKCLESLYFPEIDVRKSQVSPAASGTASWVWTHPVYRSFSTQQSGILWVRGKPGSGKSVLAKAIQERLLPESRSRSTETNEALLGDWFYHRRRGGSFIKHESLVRSMLYHFLQQRPSLYDKFFQGPFRAMDPCLPASWTSDGLVEIFEKICQSAIHVFCIVDAVDEAETTDVVPLLKSAVCSGQSSRAKLIILSRPNAEIEYQVIDHPCLVAEDENAEDIEKLVQLGLESLRTAIHSLHFEVPSASSGKSPQTMRRCRMRQPRYRPMANAASREKKALERMRDDLLSKAQGSILWVKLVLDKLTQEAETNQCSTLQELQEFVNIVPQELMEYYKQIVQDLTRGKSHQAAQHVRQVLMWICAAQEISEVTLDSLWEAMALLKDNLRSESLEDVWAHQVSVNSYNELWRKIYSTCGPFIEIFNPGLSAQESRVYHYGFSSVVQLMHQSVRDFLSDSDAAGVLHFTIEQATDMVRRHLMHYLSLFVRDSAGLRADGPQESRFLIEWLNEQRLLHTALAEARTGNWDILVHVEAIRLWELEPPLEACEQILHRLFVSTLKLEETPARGEEGIRQALNLSRLFYRACADGLVTAVRAMQAIDWPPSEALAALSLAAIIFAATRCHSDKVKINPISSAGPDAIEALPLRPPLRFRPVADEGPKLRPLSLNLSPPSPPNSLLRRPFEASVQTLDSEKSPTLSERRTLSPEQETLGQSPRPSSPAVTATLLDDFDFDFDTLRRSFELPSMPFPMALNSGPKSPETTGTAKPGQNAVSTVPTFQPNSGQVLRSESVEKWEEVGWILEISTVDRRRKIWAGFRGWHPFLDYVCGSKARALEQARGTGTTTGPQLVEMSEDLAPIEDVEDAILAALESQSFDRWRRNGGVVELLSKGDIQFS
ncbi:kinesin [Fusarium albosuccineum]|uniref:Kinesin n=1 Tax=Fusarium albosuccineum TaxID=1237068 RepID=A0A8H4L376_9HYPO|nr:kinesin [Fusarium albosuccineum]